MKAAMIRMSNAARRSKRERGVAGRAAASMVVLSTVSHPRRHGQAGVSRTKPVCYVETGRNMEMEEVKITARSNPSQRIIALGIVFAFLYVASSIVMTLLLAVLLAHFLDPIVGALERIHIHRVLGALLALLAVTAIFIGLGYLVVDRAEQFLADWPRYSAILRHATTAFDRQLSTVEKQVEAIAPAGEKVHPPARTIEPPPVREWLFQGVGSLYSILLVATFVPFLVFFMLAGKRRIWKATMELFPDEHQESAKEALEK